MRNFQSCRCESLVSGDHCERSTLDGLLVIRPKSEGVVYALEL